MWAIRIHPLLRASIVLVGLALATEAATNNLDETATSLLGAEERLAPKEGAVAEPLDGVVTYTPGRRLQESRLEKRTKLEHDDKLATAPSSRALVLTPQQAAALGPEGIIRIQRLTGPITEAIRVERGKLYFKSIGPPQPDDAIKVLLTSGDITIHGTEFYIEATTNGATLVFMLNGSASLSGPSSSNSAPIPLHPGDRGEVGADARPRLGTSSPMSKQLFNETVQWCLYYPAVLFLEDLSDEFRREDLFRESLHWYDVGAVERAWESLPPEGSWNTDEKKLYAAALLLAIGDVERAQTLLERFQAASRSAEPDHLQRLAAALRQLIAAVKFDETFTPPFAPQLSTEWLARSYYLQASVHDPHNIENALAAARRSTSATPQATNFAYAWAQVAALQFSGGHIKEAQLAVTNALRLAPSNAAPYALQGFLQAAQDRRAEAEASFKQALDLNAKLGDAWLGLGLMAFHNNDPTNGLQRLQIAVVHEPQRSVLRSYLGKGYYEAATFSANPFRSLQQLFTPGDPNRAALIKRAEEELKMARLLDPNDPTPDLYSALIKQQQNRINEAVRELERSKELNDNRRLYRSGLLLDQDQAVRSANLAAIYHDAGMTDWSVREATRSVNSDYANYSAHLFLANSYDALRDPRQVNLRYETPWFNELLLANLLAPVGAGSLSQSISQQEYSRLFEHDYFGIASGTEYSSRGDWQQYASQYGVMGSTSYALDAFHINQRGYRPNDDFSQLTFWGKFKEQLTPQDSILVETFFSDYNSGDVLQYYDPAQADPLLRYKEHQDPNVFVGYHREWMPGSHTLFLAGRLQDRVTLSRPKSTLLALTPTLEGNPPLWETDPNLQQNYTSDLDAYSAELQQIWQSATHTLIAGSRFQTGTAKTRSEFTPSELVENGDFPPLRQTSSEPLERFNVYGYYSWEVLEPLRLVAGLSYDRLVFPSNIVYGPITSGKRVKSRVSPKAGFIWTITTNTYLRGNYTRSLGGIYYDQSVRLEPSQVAGFTQAFRSIIPESGLGEAAGSRFETWELALERQFHRGLYLGVEGEVLKSAGDRFEGALDTTGDAVSVLPLRRELDYREESLTVTVNQLIGSHWSFGARYRLSYADLRNQLSAAYSFSPPPSPTEVEGTLHQLRLYGLFNHPSGFFGQLESVWYSQSNRGYIPDHPGDDFWQHNAYAGYRFPQRRAELSVGLLNISDRDYRLNPLNLHPELPRERTFVARLKFNF